MTAKPGLMDGSHYAIRMNTSSTVSIAPDGAILPEYNNPEVDKLLEQARRELDRENKGGPLYMQAERLISMDCPSVFLMNTFSSSAWPKTVTGFEHTPYDGFGAQLAATKPA